METQIFTLPTAALDVGLLPPEARVPGTLAFREAVSAFFERAFSGFGGRAEVVVRDDQITVSWHADPARQNPLRFIIEKLQRGERTEGIQLLRLLLARNPDDMEVLYNLGLALSEAGRIEEAEAHLRRVALLAPDFVNGLAALGTILTRQQKNEEAREWLEAATRLAPANGWILRNLAVVLMKTGRHEESAARFREAVTLNLSDQGAWLGLADALEKADNRKKAEEAYRHVISLNPHNELAEAARAGLGKLALSGFRANAVGGLRPDAIEYCAAAIKRFSAMSDAEVQAVAMEIATAGRAGIDVNSPAKRYQLSSLAGDFSGLQLVCCLYVALQRISPGAEVGFDLAREYEAARSMEN